MPVCQVREGLSGAKYCQSLRKPILGEDAHVQCPRLCKSSLRHERQRLLLNAPLISGSETPMSPSRECAPR